ncbi:hypothetical protein HJC23_013859 [Cyclotella cryptica]|uniref:Multidrug and toxic compound extrusion protein n=1 Tax=Cyclotella cryptica TaxID=29204 RepID=A0ABD3PAM6_9STRA|eukprot:CCRYP_016323-RA/>CCRYP_016323-RA protein AED:0.40 eAED:0.37 QI:0/0/0/1/1/1/2/0/876
MQSIIPPSSSMSLSTVFVNNFSPLTPPFSRSLNIITDDDQVYDNYVPTTNDPGNKLFIIAVFICLGSLTVLPFAVTAGRRRIRVKQQQANRRENGESQDEITERGHDGPHHTQLSGWQRIRHWYVSILHAIVDSLVMWRHAHHETQVHNGMIHEARASVANIPQANIPQNINVGSSDSNDALNITYGGERNENTGVSIESFEIEPSSDNVDINNDNDNNQENRGNQNKGIIRPLGQYIITLAKYDNESQRILRLAIPFMTNNLIKTLSDLILLAIISQSLGTDSMIAFAMVEVIVGVSSSFMMGWIETVNSLGAMAQGAENYELVGKYLQIAILTYVICEVPMAFIWGFSMHNIILLFGFDENTANISKGYVWVFMADRIMFGILQAFIDFLGLIDRERLGMVFSCSCDLSKVALVAIVLKANEDTTLTIVGLTMLANTCLFVFLTIVISSCKQLTRPYEYGMIGELSFRDRGVVKALVKTGLPLAVGGLLAYAEWEILTIFAAVLGPAEAATWAILGFVWDVFESTTEAIGDAAEVRCAYQLGKGRPEMAKLSAYKSMLLSLVAASIITTVFLLLNGYLPEWLTTDETIQEMLIELFPLIGLGNLTMTVGMVCWALIGAQARYQLATAINLACSLLITVPLGAVFTVWLRIDLQGLTFSIVVGYVICALIMAIVLLVSDWDALSKNIRERVANGDIDIESCSTDASGLYGAYDWDELPADVQAAALLLGYTKNIWNQDKEPNEAEKSWQELTPDQQAAANVLGYDEDMWNSDGSVPGGKRKSGSNYDSVSSDDDDAMPDDKRYSDTQETASYDHLDWDELPPEVQKAAEKLGFHEDSWDDDEEPEECDKDWNQLSEEERDAARVLGYDERRWNSD